MKYTKEKVGNYLDKKKVLHFIDSGGLYGAENVILNLSREMETHDEYSPIIGCIVSDKSMDSDLYDHSLNEGLESYKFRIRNAILFLDLLIAAKIIQRLKISLIHCHGYKAYVFAFLIGKLIGVPVVSTCHLWFLDDNPPFKMRFMIKIELLLYRFAPIVISVSASIRDFLTSAGISAKKIEIIDNGIPVNAFQESDCKRNMRLREELDLTNDDFVILNVGRLSRQKAQKNIIDSAVLLKNSTSSVRFLIAGDGELRKELEQYIEQHKLNHNVRLLGFRKDIKELLSIADAFLLPSLDEGMPISLLEAAAGRLPIVTTPVGDIPNLITHNESGLIVSINDPQAIANAVLQLFGDTKLRKRLATKAMERMYSRYSSKHMYIEYIAIYKKLINAKGRRRNA